MKRLHVDWHSTEHYGESFEVPDDFDHTDTGAVAQLISDHATYNWKASSGAEIDTVTVSD